MQKEESIEDQILEWLYLNMVDCEKKITKWFFNEKRWFYQKNKSRFAKRGSSDIHGTIRPYGRALYIEVKKPSEMKFFDRPIDVIREEKHKAIYFKKIKKSTIKKYDHAIEQNLYIQAKIECWAVAFFASSILQCRERMKTFWLDVD